MPTLNRTHGYYIFRQNDDIITNFLNENDKIEVIHKTDLRYASLNKIIKVVKRSNMTVDAKNDFIRDILIDLGVSADTVDRRLYEIKRS